MNRKFILSVSAFMSAMILLNACAKIDQTQVGLDIIPEVDNVNTFELLLPVEIDNHALADSTRITASTSNAIGIIEDPVFGTTEAGMYFSLNPARYPVYPFINKETAVLDSVVLSIAYSALYGDTTLPQTLEVYPISNTPGNFKYDSIFQIGNHIDIESNMIVSKTFYPMYLKDSQMVVTKLDAAYVQNVLRMRITDLTWANQFLQYDTTTQYQSDSAFKTYFKGLAVKASASSPNKRALTYWNLSNTELTKMTFYFRYTRDDNGTAVTDTTSYDFVFNFAAGAGQGTQANLITRTPGGDYDTYLNNGTPNDDLGFIQTSPGSYLSVKVPGLDTLKNTNRIVHRAELVFQEVVNTDYKTFLPPNLLFIDAISKTGDSVFTIRRDFIPTSSEYGYDIASLEGYYRTDKYAFNLTRFVQSAITNNLPVYDFRVYSPYATYPYYQDNFGNLSMMTNYLFISDYIAAGRVVVGGGNHPEKKAYMRIIYSKL